MKVAKSTPKAGTPAPVVAAAVIPPAKTLKTKKVVPETGSVGDTTPVQKTGKNIGRSTGMRIMQFQDKTMSEQHKLRLTDDELATKWQTEFPDSRCRFESRPEIIRTVRKLYNAKQHGNQQIFSDEVVPRYGLDAKGRRVVIEEEKRGRRPGEPAATDEATA